METVSFTVETDGLEPGEYPVTVSTANETAETIVTVEEPRTCGIRRLDRGYEQPSRAG